MNLKTAITILTLGLVFSLLNSLTDKNIFLLISIPLVLIGIVGSLSSSSKRQTKVALLFGSIATSIMIIVMVLISQGVI